MADTTPRSAAALPAEAPLVNEEDVLALLEHQDRAVQWARMREANPLKGVRGGALYAEMGLGKTVMGMEVCEGKLNLLSCPKGLMNVWREHLTQWHPERKVLYFHKDIMGASRYNNMTYDEMTSADMVITTYDVIQGVDRKHKFAESEAVSVLGEGLMEGKVVEVKCRRSLVENKAARGEDLLYCIKWRRLMLDEGHKICNHTTKVFKAMMAMYGEYRWVLTGTLIRNNDKNLWAILRFLGYTGCPSSRNWDEGVYFREKLNQLILAMDYEDANIELPAAHTHNIEYVFGEKEQAAYDVVKKRVVSAYNNMMLGNTSFMYVLALFTRLRQMCIAPHLITPEAKRSWRPSSSPTDEKARAELDAATGGLETWIHDRDGTAGIHSAKMNSLKEKMRAIPAGEKVIIFSVWTSALDLVEDAFAAEFGATRGDLMQAPASSASAPNAAVVDEERKESASVAKPKYTFGTGLSASAPAAAKSTEREVKEMLAADGDFDDLPPEERAEMIAELADELKRKAVISTPAAGELKPFTMVMLDGDSSMRQRKESVNTFINDPNCRVLLANSKTAGEGLTLIVANHVFQLEPWWCPAVHEQNFSRAHRYPQQKECHLYNFYAKDSIETEMVMEVCKKKDAIRDRFFGKDAGSVGAPAGGRAPGLGKAMLGQILGVY
jgi:SNF2 family DNA or RNA helicase